MKNAITREDESTSSLTSRRGSEDEFLYLLMDPGGKVNVERIADSVLRGIVQPLAVGDREFAIKPSIGVALYPNDGDLGNELIRNADAAMYSAKRQSRGVAFFDGKLTTSFDAEAAIPSTGGNTVN